MQRAGPTARTGDLQHAASARPSSPSTRAEAMGAAAARGLVRTTAPPLLMVSARMSAPATRWARPPPSLPPCLATYLATLTPVRCRSLQPGIPRPHRARPDPRSAPRQPTAPPQPPHPHFLGCSAAREERPPSRRNPVHSLARRRGVAQLGSAPASGAGMSRRARPRDGAPATVAILPGHIPGHVGRRLMPLVAVEGAL